MKSVNKTETFICAGVDEAGRGPLAGPVIAAAVILDNKRNIKGLADSKKISPGKRERLANDIYDRATAWAIGRAEVEEIDKINILQASLLAMKRAVTALKIQPDSVLVDGNCSPDWDYHTECIIKGDASVPEISAASILAKVNRDHELILLDSKYPGYGLARHKGYPTKQHIQAIKQLGVTPVHRKTFSPVYKILNEGLD